MVRRQKHSADVCRQGPFRWPYCRTLIDRYLLPVLVCWGSGTNHGAAGSPCETHLLIALSGRNIRFCASSSETDLHSASVIEQMDGCTLPRLFVLWRAAAGPLSTFHLLLSDLIQLLLASSVAQCHEGPGYLTVCLFIDVHGRESRPRRLPAHLLLHLS
jgi:hypothetical protein